MLCLLPIVEGFGTSLESGQSAHLCWSWYA